MPFSLVWVNKVTTLGPTNLNSMTTAMGKMPYGPDFSADNVPIWNGSSWVSQKVAAAQIAANTITESQVTAGTLTNASINASAAIAQSKLAFDAYQNYTPTWTSTGTAPAIGNASVVGRYAQIGKFVHCHGIITFGSTSTFGTGSYRFALPVTASASAISSGCFGIVDIFDSSASSQGTGVISAINASGTFQLSYAATLHGTSNAVGQTTPWTWAVGDLIAWNFTYEAA